MLIKITSRIFVLFLLILSFAKNYDVFCSDEFTAQENIDLMLEAENITKNSKTQIIKYYLPKEVSPEYITENNGFVVDLDISKGQYYLQKEVSFAPGEIKVFSFKVENVWKTPYNDLTAYLKEAEQLRDNLSGKDVYQPAEMLYKTIKHKYNEIMAVQGKADSVKRHIEQFRINEKKIAQIRDAIDKMRKLQPDSEKTALKIKINGKKIRNIIIILVVFVSIVAFSFWKIWGNSDDGKNSEGSKSD